TAVGNSVAILSSLFGSGTFATGLSFVIVCFPSLFFLVFFDELISGATTLSFSSTISKLSFTRPFNILVRLVSRIPFIASRAFLALAKVHSPFLPSFFFLSGLLGDKEAKYK